MVRCAFPLKQSYAVNYDNCNDVLHNMNSVLLTYTYMILLFHLLICILILFYFRALRFSGLLHTENELFYRLRNRLGTYIYHGTYIMNRGT